MKEPLQQIVSDVSDIAERTGAKALLVGAWARGACLGEQDAGRMTQDIDFAVYVQSHATAFAKACEGAFEPLSSFSCRTTHRATSTRVDFVFCGGVEDPPGTVVIANGDRRLNTTGLSEACADGPPLDQARGFVLRPTPQAFVLLKLFAWRDRAEPRDLQDAAVVIDGWLEVSAVDIFDDEALLARFANGLLTVDDAPAFLLGRRLADNFVPETVTSFCQLLDDLLGSPAMPWLRTVPPGVHEDPDDQARLARRRFEVLRDGVTA
jgi:predicted nucleotidyltransferase